MSALGKLPYVIASLKTDEGLPKPGDAVVVLRGDGSSGLYLLEIEHKELLARLKAGDDLTDAELGQLLAAQKAVALYLVSQNDKMMETLVELVNSPDFLGEGDMPSLS